MVLFLIVQFVSIRGSKGSGPLDVPGQWQCGICGAIRCWPTRNQCCKCAQLRSASSRCPRSSTYLDPQGAVGGLPQGFPGSSPLILGMVHGPLGRGPPPERSQTPPTSRRGPAVSPKPPPGAGTGYVRFDEGPLIPPPAPVSAQPVNQVLPPWATCWLCHFFLLVRLLILWRISSVLWSS